MDVALLALGIGVVAFLYSSVGHAGASGYIALMALAGLPAATIKPVALSLNILVAVVGTVAFVRAGHFTWRLFWPFAAISVPAAFLGGYWRLSPGFFNVLVAIVLLGSAIRFFWQPGEPAQVRHMPLAGSLAIGGGIGLLSGLTGTGGGIFLSPLLLLGGWAKTKEVAATSVAFILVNSVAGLAGHSLSREEVPGFTVAFGVAALAGGALGSHLGSRRFQPKTVQILLGCVLVVAGAKLILNR